MLDCGRLVKTWGNRGNLLLDPDLDGLSEELAFPVPVLLRFPRKELSHSLTDCREWGGRWLLGFEGVTDLSSAYLLVGSHLLLPDGVLEEPAEDSWVGYTLQEPTGRILGVISKDDRKAMNPLLTVNAPEGRTHLVPAPPEWLLGLDTERRVVVLRLPDGLLEL